ncbi:electron transport complex protein RnfG|uniref:Ion-translocating oxidoreductase complex subunit G n=1 Tax=Brenneria salicis ATCC 15712 = DSM 30166 TaxID=714314 RepID=A0A366I3Q4_9GAMM|nr:electron transport complex subunit RsxG [Brenneria salicis]NMN91660.1 electron transport complex protein RnfG [Brenneria salicis ATCC 15712 = DSM 30166]RBP61427.1 electron transport complex protein RnfG [Brenneria salicis ATCC 15712 = DSM 30166]RLM30354.1 electron transport complex subunit RsxG [Brenneria salicis ATCC 15712 = DSM 30166]
MFTTMRRHATTLALFAALTTAMSAVVNSLTAPTISRQALLQQKALLDQVVPIDRYNNDMQQECYIVTDLALGSTSPHRLFVARKDGIPVAAAVESTAPDGYSGAIQLLIGADFAGNVLGTRVTAHRETPGLGDKIEIRISDWITRFSGQTVQGSDDARWAVKKEGGMFDQFTGATITPRAVINRVKRSTLYLQTLPSRLNTLPVCGENK